MSFLERISNPRRAHGLLVRERVLDATRLFFKTQGFREVQTPLLVRSPGMEPHIRPISVKTASDPPVFLPTSPEFAMKRLLVGGMNQIFQICPAFRDEPTSPHHSPEFTMLEWYRSREAYTGFDSIFSDVENLFHFISERLQPKNPQEIRFGDQIISIKSPWPRFSTRELFLKFTGLDLVKTQPKDFETFLKKHSFEKSDSLDWDDLYFLVWLNFIEPTLPQDRAFFVTHYPSSQAALAQKIKDREGNLWANRFEVYAGGIEIANAFDELTHVDEQRRRFEEDMNLREKVYGAGFPKSPIDEDFLAALKEGLPPSGGIALGMDRLIMLFANEPVLDFTLALPSFWPNPA